MRARTAALALLGFLSGCYNYLTLTTPAPQPGARVAVELTDSGTAALARYLGPDVGSVEGQLVTVSDQAVQLSVVAVRGRNGIEHYWKGETVTLPRGDIARLRERRLAIGRSVFLGLASVGGSIALLEAFGVFSSGSSSSGQPPPPQ